MKNSLLEKVKTLTDIHCSSGNMPMICAKASTQAGLVWLTNRITYLVEKEGLSVEESLPHIEQQLNNL